MLKDITMRISNNVTLVMGIVLKDQNKYVAWNSFKSCFYLGNKEHSEIFPWLLFQRKDPFCEKAKKAFPSAKEILIGE
jgi:hypothetical protein